jgi:uncharacterized phiE125 gp8 family phage protein
MTRGLDIKIVTDIAEEPVGLEEMKSYLNVDLDNWDTLIETLISSSRTRLERYTGCSFGEKELIATFYETADNIEIPYGPIVEITSVKSIGDSGDKTDLVEGSDYVVIGNDYKVVKFFQTGTPIEIEYTAGYSVLPSDLKVAVMKQVAMDFEYRETVSDNRVVELSNSAKQLASSYRRVLMF